MKNIVICGYYGFSNSGDDALLWAIIDVITKKHKDVKITVLSNQPESTTKVYGVDSIYRYNLIQINRLFRKADLLLLGGGSLIQDITSTRSLSYYLMMLKMAYRHNVKTMLYGNGIGPLCREKSLVKAAKVLQKVDVITLRDAKSETLLEEMGVTKPVIKVTADPAFTLDFEEYPDVKSLLESAKVDMVRPYATIAIRSWKTLDMEFVDKVAHFCDILNNKYGIQPLFIPMKYEDDIAISKTVIAKMSTKGCVVGRPLSVEETFSVVSGATLTIGMRLHILIYSAILGIPVMALSYDPKVEDFMNSIHQELCLNVEDMEVSVLKNMLDEVMGDYDKKKDEMRKVLADLRARAEMNADMAVEIL